jgi:TolA-binding protein
MKRAWWLVALTSGCVHAVAPRAMPAQAAVPLESSPADIAYEAAVAELAAARYQSAGQLFKSFADSFPKDRRVATARLQEAFTALDGLDQVQGLDEAQAILSQLPAQADPVAVRELHALILARAQALQAQAAVAEVLTRCEGESDTALDKERAQAHAQMGRLQTELQRRERTLDQVKQRLLEIQQLATEMLGGSLPAPPATAGTDDGKGQSTGAP